MNAKKGRNRLLSLLMTLAMLLVLLPTTTLAANAPSSIVFTGVGTEERVGLNEDRGFYLVNGAAASSGMLGEGGCTAYYDKAAGTLYLSGFTGKVVSLEHTGDAEVKINLSGENNIEWINGNAGSGTTIEITSTTGGTLNVSRTGDGDLVGIDAGSSGGCSKGKVILSGNAVVNVTLTHLTKVSGNSASGIYAREGIEIKDAASFSAVLNAKTANSNNAFGLNVKNNSRYDIVINTTGTVDIDCSSDTSQYTYPIFNNTGSGKKVDLQNVGRMTLKYRKYSLNKESSPEITYPSTLERTATTTDTIPAITTVTYAPPSTKTDPTINTNPTASPITYGQTLASSTLSGGVASVEGTFAWKTPTTAPQVSDSNNTEYEVIFTPTDTEHYNTVTCKVKLKVNPKGIAATVADIPDQPYTGSQIKPTITVTDGAGTTLTKDTDYTVTYGANTAVGPASVHIKAVAGGNYKFTNASSTNGEVTKNFTIKKGSLTVTILGDYDKTYDGSAVCDHSVLVKNTIGTELSSSDYTVTYTYYICMDTPGDITTETTTENSGAAGTGVAPVYAGNYVVEATVTADNYETATGRKEFSIAKKDATVRNIRQTSPETIYNTTYLFNIVLDGDKTPSEGTLKLDSDQTLEVGTKNYNWTFTPNDTRNYNAIRGSIPLTVEQDPGATTYTVRFNANGGTGTMADVTGISGSYPLPANGFTAPSGKQFKGWATTADGAVITGTINVTADTTLYAIWEDIPATTYTVTVQSDGNGTASASPATAAADTEVTLSATANDGYHFKEWQVVSGGVTITNNKFTMPSSDVTVKAIFEANEPTPEITYTVRFNANGGTGTMADVTGISGSYPLPANGFTAPAGKQFKGWATTANGAVITGTINVTADTTLYAIWENISDSGSGTITIIVPSTEEPTKPADQKNPSTGAAPGSIGYDTLMGLAAAGVLCFAAIKLAKKDEE